LDFQNSPDFDMTTYAEQERIERIWLPFEPATEGSIPNCHQKFVVMNASLAQEAHGITIRARQTH